MNALLIRLAFAGIRARLLASTLTILIAAAIAATVVIALEVGATGRDPWQRTFNAAHGADVLAMVSTEAVCIGHRSVAPGEPGERPRPTGRSRISPVSMITSVSA
jgi:hypothetical protein